MRAISLQADYTSSIPTYPHRYLKQCLQFWASQCEREIEPLERVLKTSQLSILISSVAPECIFKILYLRLLVVTVTWFQHYLCRQDLCCALPFQVVGGKVKKPGKRGRKPAKIDLKAKLERSRQSARECRARKKLRYQYLEELVSSRERAICALREELEMVRIII